MGWSVPVFRQEKIEVSWFVPLHGHQLTMILKSLLTLSTIEVLKSSSSTRSDKVLGINCLDRTSLVTKCHENFVSFLRSLYCSTRENTNMTWESKSPLRSKDL